MGSLTMILEWIPGRWYFAVDCHVCGWQFPFARVDDPLPECPIQLTCIDCQQSDYYCAKEFVRVEAK